MDLLLSDILPVLALFYVVEGLVIVRPFQRVFVSRALGRGFDLLRPGLGYLGLAPWRVMAAVQTLPGLGSEDGFHAVSPALREEPPVLRVTDLQLTSREALAGVVADQKKLKVGKRVVAVAATPEDARRFAAELRAFASTGVEAPAKIDVQAAREGWRRTHPLLTALRSAATLAWGGWFVALPAALLWADRTRIDLTLLLVDVVLVHFGVVALALATLIRGRVPAARIGSVISQLFILPSSAARAAYHVSRELLRSRHPAEVAATLLTEADLAVLARRELAKIDFSAEHTASLGLGSAWTQRADAWRTALRQAGVETTPALVARSASANAQRYCRVCEAEYLAAEVCSDCRVPLAPLKRDVAA